MWRWIGGVVVIIVLCLVGAIWAGYRKITSGGDVASITIAGSPDRVFAALANHDSLPSWWVMKGSPVPMGHGPLAVGDSLPSQTPRAQSRALSNWIVDQVVPGKLLVLSLRSGSAGIMVAVLRDSLVARGDSTEVVTTVSSPMMADLQDRDSVRQSKGGSAVVGMSSKLLVSGLRFQSKLELTRLKSHIEGRVAELQP